MAGEAEKDEGEKGTGGEEKRQESTTDSEEVQGASTTRDSLSQEHPEDHKVHKVNGKEGRKTELGTPTKAQAAMESTEIKGTKRTKASCNMTKKMEESKQGQSRLSWKRKRPKGGSRKLGKTNYRVMTIARDPRGQRTLHARRRLCRKCATGGEKPEL